MNEPTEPSRSKVSPTIVRYLVVAALCAAALVAYVQRNSISVAEESIRERLHLTKHEMGWVMSSFFLTYALFQLPTGYLAKRLGTRRALSIFATTFSAAAVAFALAMGLWTLLAARLAMGALQSGIFPCAVNTVSKWLPDQRRSFATGMLGSFMSVGGALGASLTGLLLGGFMWEQFTIAGVSIPSMDFEGMDWRWVFGIFALPGFVFAALFYLWFRDRPKQHRWVNDAEIELIRGTPDAAAVPGNSSADSDESHEPTPWGVVLRSPAVWGLCGQQVMRAAGYMFFASWFATYLRETRPQVGDLEVGLLNSLPLLAVVVGSPVGGIVADWVLARTGSRRLSRQGVAAAAMLVCAVLILVAYPIADPWLAVLLISAGSFCAAFGGPCAYTSSIDMGGRHVTMVFSLMNTAGNIGAFVFPIVVPLLLNESELYIDRIELRPVTSSTSMPDPIVIEAENFTRSEHAQEKPVGRNDRTAIRFHHSMKHTPDGTDRLRIITEYEIDVTRGGPYELNLRYVADDPPPLRLTVNGRAVRTDALGGQDTIVDADGVRKQEVGAFLLQNGKNTIRLETETTASGNWDLVLFLFAGMYVAAFAAWLFANPNAKIDSPQ